MKKNPRCLAALVALLAGCQAHAPCALRGSAEVVLDEGAPNAPGSRRLVLWEVDNDPVLWTTRLPASPTLATFQDEARRRIGDVSPRAILERAIEQPTSERETGLNRMVLGEVDRRVVPIRCFDAIFLARQTERMDMVRTPTEVLAYVFRSPDGRRLRIVEYTVNAPGIGRVGPVFEQVDEIAAGGGWVPWTVFHNHNFFFEGGDWKGGSVAPSAPDTDLMVILRDERGLGEAWITNGFSTLLLPTAALTSN